ncbi:MAG TPA: ABC transporter permease [Blastocatellia bacterium]
MGKIKNIAKKLIGRNRVERELDEELGAYLDNLTAEKMRAGMARDEAVKAAARQIGSIDLVKEQVREATAANFISSLIQDIRYGVRMMTASPGLTLVAVISLALGIGGNAAMFSLVSNVLIKPLPYPQPDRLVQVTDYYPKGAIQALQQQARTIEIAGYSTDTDFNLTGAGQPLHLAGCTVSANLFSLLGVNAQVGRTFTAGEDLPGRDRLVILSNSLWRSKFGGDRNVIGHNISIDGTAHEIIGVLPPDFGFPSSSIQLWMPITLDPSDEAAFWGAGYMPLIGRLQPGTMPGQAQSEIRSLIPGIIKLFPFSMPNWNMDAAVISLQQSIVGDIRGKLIVLLCAVGLVLLIACVNVASLLLARTTARQKEMAVRAALGAGRARIIRQLLTESVLLALLGAGLGMGLAFGALSVLKSVLPADNTQLIESTVDLRVLLFVTLMAVLSGLTFGLAPAFSASKFNLSESMRSRGQTSASAGKLKLRSFLIAAEVALAVVLVVGAGLLIKSLWMLTRLDPGFSSSEVVAVRIYPDPSSSRDRDACIALYDQLLQRASRLTGVYEAAAANTVPLSHEVPAVPVEFEGHTVDTNINMFPIVWAGAVTPDYFHLMKIHLLDGRTFTNADAEKAAPVVVVDSATAKQYWPGENPIGKHIRISWEPAWRTVIGVVNEVCQYDLAVKSADWTHGAMYMPYPQSQVLNRQIPTAMSLMLRISGNATEIGGEVRSLVSELNPNVPVSDAEPMDSVVSSAMSGSRSLMWLFVGFAGSALFLAAIGTYGVISYSTSQRISELGLRLALGATKGNLFSLVLGQSVKLVAAGLILGIGVSVMMTKMLTAFLFGVGATDPVTFLSVAVLLILIGVLAGYLPARRAASVDPLVALRVD